MILSTSALVHVFGDQSGALIYNVDNDVSVLLNASVFKVETSSEANTLLTISDDAIKKDLIKKGLVVE